MREREGRVVTHRFAARLPRVARELLLLVLEDVAAHEHQHAEEQRHQQPAAAPHGRVLLHRVQQRAQEAPLAHRCGRGRRWGRCARGSRRPERPRAPRSRKPPLQKFTPTNGPERSGSGTAATAARHRRSHPPNPGTCGGSSGPTPSARSPPRIEMAAPLPPGALLEAAAEGRRGGRAERIARGAERQPYSPGRAGNRAGPGGPRAARRRSVGAALGGRRDERSGPAPRAVPQTRTAGAATALPSAGTRRSRSPEPGGGKFCVPARHLGGTDRAGMPGRAGCFRSARVRHRAARPAVPRVCAAPVALGSPAVRPGTAAHGAEGGRLLPAARFSLEGLRTAAGGGFATPG